MEQVRKGLLSGVRARFEGLLGGKHERLLDIPWLRPRIERGIDALGECMFPAGAEIPYSAKDVELTKYMIDFFYKIPTQQSNMLCMLILAYEFALPTLYRKGWLFSQMSFEDQTDLLEHLHDSRLYPIRMLNVALRMFMSFGYMADERVLQEMGYFKNYAYPSDPRDIEIIERISQELQNTIAKELDQEENLDEKIEEVELSDSLLSTPEATSGTATSTLS